MFYYHILIPCFNSKLLTQLRTPLLPNSLQATTPHFVAAINRGSSIVPTANLRPAEHPGSVVRWGLDVDRPSIKGPNKKQTIIINSNILFSS
jgi:hypothetical protein